MTAKQQRAIEALPSVPSIRQAAVVARSGEKTKRRWLQIPEFSLAYQEARQQAFAEAMADLRAATHDAVDALRRAINEETGAVRLKAATATIELSIRSAETLEIETRLERLERELNSHFNPTQHESERP
jgi:hypothetical protein